MSRVDLRLGNYLHWSVVGYHLLLVISLAAHQEAIG